MEHIFSRLSMLVGKDGIEKLKNSSVIVFGAGGVGSYAIEALARSGIGRIAIVDFDEVSPSNINRQLHALHSTVGLVKADIMRQRILDINPECKVLVLKELVFRNVPEIFQRAGDMFDFVVDSIDTIHSKVKIIEYCIEKEIRIISSMGFGNKMHPEKIEIGYIEDTSVCPMARAVRRILSKKGIKGIPVAFSKEEVIKPDKDDTYSKEEPTEYRKNNLLPMKVTPGSNAFVPGTAGLVIAGYVVRNLLGMK